MDLLARRGERLDGCDAGQIVSRSVLVKLAQRLGGCMGSNLRRMEAPDKSAMLISS